MLYTFENYSRCTSFAVDLVVIGIVLMGFFKDGCAKISFLVSSVVRSSFSLELISLSVKLFSLFNTHT